MQSKEAYKMIIEHYDNNKERNKLRYQDVRNNQEKEMMKLTEFKHMIA
jgi:hypothetical protein